MKRRDFVKAIGAATAAWPLAVHAQQSGVPVIGFLSSRSPDESAHLVAAFRNGLAETGYVEGQNVGFVFRWAEGRRDRVPALADDLISRNVNVIAATGGNVTALTARERTATIPIVFTSGIDPVRTGLVESLSRPGANVTGVSWFSSQLTAKGLGLLHELVPKA